MVEPDERTTKLILGYHKTRQRITALSGLFMGHIRRINQYLSLINYQELVLIVWVVFTCLFQNLFGFFKVVVFSPEGLNLVTFSIRKLAQLIVKLFKGLFKVLNYAHLIFHVDVMVFCWILVAFASLLFQFISILIYFTSML